MKITQREFVTEQLKANGFISRNFCLNNYISRLGAIICQLSKEGWKFEPKTVNGDYVYYLIKSTPKAIILPDSSNIETDTNLKQDSLFNIKGLLYGIKR